ncbi:MAG: NAD-dependent protein deacylase [Lachnospiraceae bacterium]|nr:NAD-dependent protein deacylase [Lachnospiraceae bacterium]
MENIEKLQKIIDESRNIVFFGGAGVSTASNIPDFRSSDGLFQRKYPYPAETMLSKDFFKGHKEEFYDFYVNNMIYPDARPNYAHSGLAALEKKGKLKAVITQNIDGLHQEAGSINVLELHGSIHRNYCTKCRGFYPLDYVLENLPVPLCTCGGVVKPDVVLYGEGLDTDTLDNALKYISEAHTLIIGGTSLSVYPAASLVNYFKGTNLILINKESTAMDRNAGLLINDDIDKVFKALKI